MKQWISFSILIILILICAEILTESKSILDAVSFSLSIWKNNIFPSLFPFFVLSEIMVKYGMTEFIGNLLKPFMNKLFRIKSSEAINAGSASGHLVLSTVHTNNSLNTIERLIDMDVPKYLLASALEGIVSQKLARKLCPHCRTLRKTTTYEREIFKTTLGKDVLEIYDNEGCEHCHGGYSGRIAIQEVLLINQQIRDALSENVSKEQLREMVYGSDVVTLLQDGLNKVIEGKTTFEEILRLIALDDDEKLSNNMFLKNAVANSKRMMLEKEVQEKMAEMQTNENPEVIPTTPISHEPTIPHADEVENLL